MQTCNRKSHLAAGLERLWPTPRFYATVAHQTGSTSKGATVILSEKQIASFWRKVKISTSDQCWLWQAYCGNFGYGRFLDFRAHRISYELIFGEIPKGLFVLHKCDVPACVNPNHLFLGTALDNIHDAMNKGRLKPGHGSRHARANFTEEQIVTIRKMGETIPFSHIARRFGVSGHCIESIIHRRTWKHVI